MAGYWTIFLWRGGGGGVFMDRDLVEIHKHAEKKNDASIQPS